jgi:chromosome partitioning protein
VTKIFAVANQKGGVGKTTTSINLAASLARMHKRVLLVDLDPQGNATMGSGIDKAQLQASIYDVLTGRSASRAVLIDATDAGYVVLPANGDLTAAEVELLDHANRETTLKLALEPLAADFDIIIKTCRI